MVENQQLHEYLRERTWELTEQWYGTLDKNQRGIYSTKNPEEIENLKRQNHDFHVLFCSMFSENQQDFSQEFQDWIEEIATDDGHLKTPIVVVIEEFFRTQQQYLKTIAEFASQHKEKVTFEQLSKWNLAIVETIGKVILEFTAQNTRVAQERLQNQQQMIVEMSAPVILLTKSSGFLPLVGEITTHRAQIIFEKTLKQCAKHNLERLVVDLSGVPIIDTMVAQQVFQLITGLKIIGVKTALSGISPVIAQTAVHLGIKFTDIEVYNSLAQALKENGVQLVQ